MRLAAAVILTGFLASVASPAPAQGVSSDCFEHLLPSANALPDPLIRRRVRYAELDFQHRIAGLASYYSSFFDGRKTANGEIYRSREFSAAPLTLPLGTWIEVTSRATGKK